MKPSNKLYTKNYVTYRNDRLDRQKGGTAVLIKTHITHNIILLPQLFSLECTGVDIFVNNTQIRLIPAYKPSDIKLETIDLDNLFRENIFNSTKYNKNGPILEKYLRNYLSLSVLATDKPTHFGPIEDPDVLDIAIVKNFNY